MGSQNRWLWKIVDERRMAGKPPTFEMLVHMLLGSTAGQYHVRTAMAVDPDEREALLRKQIGGSYTGMQSPGEKLRAGGYSPGHGYDASGKGVVLHVADEYRTATWKAVAEMVSRYKLGGDGIYTCEMGYHVGVPFKKVVDPKVEENIAKFRKAAAPVSTSSVPVVMEQLDMFALMGV
jgi:hypothetical protein